MTDDNHTQTLFTFIKRMFANQSELIVSGVSGSNCHKLELNISESEKGNSKNFIEGQGSKIRYPCCPCFPLFILLHSSFP